MPQILVEDLRKTYRISERDPGFLGTIRGVFRRRYREVEALRGVSFGLEKGELLGFIGPNGAGKSTTIKILSGILRPDSGRVEVDGLTPSTTDANTSPASESSSASARSSGGTSP